MLKILTITTLSDGNAVSGALDPLPEGATVVVDATVDVQDDGSLILLSDLRDYKERRRAAYLAAWPLERQAEARTEADMGRPQLLAAMLAEMTKIREEHPKPQESPT